MQNTVEMRVSGVVGVHKTAPMDLRVTLASGYYICDKCMEDTTFVPAKPVLVRQIATAAAGATGLHRVIREPVVVCAECGLHVNNKL